jgi:hypothetical protein
MFDGSEFYNSATAAGIKRVTGVEPYIAPASGSTRAGNQWISAHTGTTSHHPRYCSSPQGAIVGGGTSRRAVPRHPRYREAPCDGRELPEPPCRLTYSSRPDLTMTAPP